MQPQKQTLAMVSFVVEEVQYTAANTSYKPAVNLTLGPMVAMWSSVKIKEGKSWWL